MTTKTRNTVYYETFYSDNRLISLPMYDRTSTWETGRDCKVPRNYDVTLSTSKLLGGPDIPNGVYSDCPIIDLSGLTRQQAYNKAYESFVGQMKGSESEWAVNLIEMGSAVDMIGSRLFQLARFSRYVSRFQFQKAANILGVKRPAGLRSSAKAFGNNWLEFHFGWEPLVQDIGNALETLSGPRQARKIRGRATEGLVYDASRNHANYYYTDLSRYRYSVLLQANVVVKDPMLSSLNEMGFVNPLGVAWELIPFSFVWDWFSNVGTILSSSTDMVGFEVSNQFVTDYVSADRQYGYAYRREQDWPSNRLVFATRMQMRRRVGAIPAPALIVKPFHGFSLSRAATACSLLLQALKP